MSIKGGHRMAKVSIGQTNDYSPQTLFLYGTFHEDGTPNFGLFCWFSYYWDKGLGVMASIGGPKMTLDRIRAKGVFSANLVTEKTLALADYFGTVAGNDPDKMNMPVAWEKCPDIDAPILTDCPVAFELEVTEFLPRDEGEVLLCRVRDVIVDEALAAKDIPLEEKMRQIAPICTTQQTYFGWDGRTAGKWHSLAGTVGKNV